MFKKILLLSLFVYSQTNCWKEIVPKSERFPLMQLPKELLEKVLLPDFFDIIEDSETKKALEDSRNKYKLASQDEKDSCLAIEKFRIHDLGKCILADRKDLIENYLKNLSKTNRFFNWYSKEVLKTFDNKFVNFFNEIFITPNKVESFLLLLKSPTPLAKKFLKSAKAEDIKKFSDETIIYLWKKNLLTLTVTPD